MAKITAPAWVGAPPFGGRRVNIRNTPHGWIAQKPPGPNKSRATVLETQTRKQFAFAAIMASSPLDVDYLTAIEMAKGTEQVPRDILTMAALGRYYWITSDGETSWRTTERPIRSDPLNIRPSSLMLSPTSWPPNPSYLVTEDGWRIALEPQP